MNVLEFLEPNKVFHFFEDLCSIPHGSSNTKQISDYCAKFAQQRNLKHRQDEMGNILIFKDASKGYENHPGVILQGHLDMVCERDDLISQINMENEGLNISIEGDYIHANGTTLGGDDGIAVAYALAVLDSDDIAHPPLVVLFTVDEEIGLLGAFGVDLSDVSARTMINIDSEEEGVFLTSCAGGASVLANIPFKTEKCNYGAFNICVNGLKGGHSGVEIDKLRGNSNKIMARFLNELSKKCEFRLVTINGGNKNNAIPLNTKAVIVCNDEQTLSEFANEFEIILKNELKTSDSGITLSVYKAENSCDFALTSVDTLNIVRMLCIAPNGIQTMSADITGLVESSLNLGVLKTTSDCIKIDFSVRSSVESLMDEIISRLEIIIKGANGSTKVRDRYPGWEFKKDSKLRDVMVEAYKKLFNVAPKVTAIHAGLETGLFSGKLEGLDCIAIGPQMHDIHTPKERLSISSTGRVWQLIIETLKRL